MKKIYGFFAIAFISLALSSCAEKVNPIDNGKDEPTPEPTVTKPSREIQQADQFAIDFLGSYYLWSEQVAKDLVRLDPDTCKTPISVVKKIRYRNAGKEVDHWTMMTDDLASMTSSVQGLGLSYGYGLEARWKDQTHTGLVFIVQYVNKGKPADKAGLKRGDVIWTINGQEIVYQTNYQEMAREAFDSQSITMEVGPGPSKLTSVSMTANKDWEDPVIVNKTFDIDGKKVGYLFYGAFDQDSGTTLPDVFRKFKEDGISELIIDLRYNGGGYTSTECELASMIAPPTNVAAKDVFQTGEIINISDANPGISKLYAIVTGGSASASEGLIVGLGPYMDIKLIGERTYGKYCAGIMWSPENLYTKESTFDYSKIKKWGMYVMISMFADKNGKNAAQPDGIPVNIEAQDDVQDGYQLGDENETMLKEALTAAGKVYPKTKASVDMARPNLDRVPDHMARSPKPKGILIKDDIPAIIQNL